MSSYLYKITHKPTGLIYIGSRKLPKNLTPDTDPYLGSPTGANKMLDILISSRGRDTSKEILAEGEDVSIRALENQVIQAAWDEYGKEHEGGLVCNLVASFPAVQMTQDVKERISCTMSGREYRPKPKHKRYNATKVYQVIPNGSGIRVWDSFAECSRDWGVADGTIRRWAIKEEKGFTLTRPAELSAENRH